MRRLKSCLVLFLFLNALFAAGALRAATTVSSTSVSTEPPGARFDVDGQTYSSSNSFLWPAGSKHTISIPVSQQPTSAKTRYNFNGWTDSTGSSTVSGNQLTITADPAITYYRAKVTVQHAVSLNFFSCASADLSVCGGSPGTIYVNNTPFTVNAEVYLDAGSAVNLRAAPNPGFVFTGWLQGLGNGTQAYLNSFTLNAPVIVFAQFLRAANITIASNPPGLKVLADDTAVVGTTILEWGLGTTHTLGVVSPQFDTHGRVWVFSSWSDGGASRHTYSVPAASPPITLTATYVPGGRVTFLTNPPLLKLTIDGRDDWPSYSFSWAAGEKHTVSAPPQQTDQSGRSWVFKAWSNGGAQSQTIALSATDVATGLRLTATYDPLSQTSIQSAPPGVHLTVDGNDCLSPCLVHLPVGSTVRVSAPVLVLMGHDTRLEFAGWSDGSAGDHSITLTLGNQVVTANYRGFYRLKYSADPPEGAVWHFGPVSPDGFYAAHTLVTVVLDILPGFRFHRWEGNASGTASVITLVIDQPLTIRARLDRVPYVGVGGVQNAAGATPENAVAPGSIVSIYGENLTDAVEIGPASPLVQTLAGVTVTVGDRLLPMMFASPRQINVQIPSALAQGQQTLEIHTTGQPDVSAIFVVQPNAPGLFYYQIDDKQFAIVRHADGSVVSLLKPARRGELMTALGTGFGPYQVQLPDGFAAPDSNHYGLRDKVELVFGDKVVTAEWAGAGAGHAGLIALRFRIGDGLPSGTTVEMKARIQGHESNTVLVPIE